MDGANTRIRQMNYYCKKMSVLFAVPKTWTCALQNIQKLQLPAEYKAPELALYDQPLQEVDGNLKAMLFGLVE